MSELKRFVLTENRDEGALFAVVITKYSEITGALHYKYLGEIVTFENGFVRRSNKFLKTKEEVIYVKIPPKERIFAKKDSKAYVLSSNVSGISSETPWSNFYQYAVLVDDRKVKNAQKPVDKPATIKTPAQKKVDTNNSSTPATSPKPTSNNPSTPKTSATSNLSNIVLPVTLPFKREREHKATIVPIPRIGGEWDQALEFSIGYTDLTREIEHISISRDQDVDTIPLLRSRGSIKKGIGHNADVITLSLNFYDSDSLGRLAQLIRQIKKAPFLPVYADRLESEGITAICILGLSVKTVEGFPGQCECTITAVKFDWRQYFPDEITSHFGDLFCWPLYKLWCETPETGDHVSGVFPTWKGLDRSFGIQTINPDMVAELEKVQNNELSDKFVSGSLFDDAAQATEILTNSNAGVSEADLKANGITTQYVLKTSKEDKERRYLKLKPSSLETLRKAFRYVDNWGSKAPSVILGKGKTISYEFIKGLIDQPKGYDSSKISTYNTKLSELRKEISLGQNEDLKVPILVDEYTLYIEEGHEFLTKLVADSRKYIPVNLFGKKFGLKEGYEAKLWNTWNMHWIIESISASFNNNFAFLNVQDYQSPQIQYLGGSDVNFYVHGTLHDSAAAEELKALWDEVSYLSRFSKSVGLGKDYKGFMRVTNNMFSLLGVDHVIFNQYENSTIPQFPNDLLFSLNLVEYDPSQSNREKIEDKLDLRTFNRNEVEKSTDSVERIFRAAKLDDRLKRLEVYPDLRLPTKKALNQMISNILNRKNTESIFEYYNPFHRGFLGQLNPGKDEVGYVNPDFYIKSFYYIDGAVAEQNTLGREKVSKPVRYTGLDGLAATLSDKTPSTRKLPLDSKDLSYVDESESKSAKAYYDQLNSTRPGWEEVTNSMSSQQRSGSLVFDKSSAFDSKSTNVKGIGQIGFRNNEDLRENAIRKYGSAPTNAALLNICNDIIGQVGSRSWGAKSASDFRLNPLMLSYQQICITNGKLYKVDPAFLMAVINTESDGNPKSTGSAGVVGIAQLNINIMNDYITKATGITPNQRLDSDAASRALSFWLSSLMAGKYSATIHYQSRNVAFIGARYNIGQNKPDGFNYDSVTETNNYQRRLTAFTILYRAFFIRNLIKKSNPTSPANFLLAMYLGELQEYLALLNKNGKPIQFNFNVYYGDEFEYIVDTTPQKTGTQLAADAINAFLGGTGDGASVSKTPRQEYEKLPVQVNNPLEDHHTYELRNSLLSAFPAYSIFLIDGGRWMGMERLSDLVFGHSGVTEIEVFQSRENPAHTATVTFSNMYRNLTNSLAEVDRQNKAGERRFSVPALTEQLEQLVNPGVTENMLQYRNQLLNSINLKAGSRLNIRLGFGSDVSRWPNVFNGTIVEVPTNDYMVQVIALGDGHELLKEMALNSANEGDKAQQTFEITAFGGSGKDPRVIIEELFMTTSDNILGNVINDVSLGKYINNNLYGIENFGRAFFAPALKVSSGDTEKKATDIASAAIRGALSAVLTPVLGPVGTVLLEQNVVATTVREVALRKSGEVGVNLYAPKNDPQNYTSGPSNVFGWFWTDSMVMTGLSLESATVWKVIDTCRMVSPDFVAQPYPFELRSTLFFGKPGWDIHYAYDFIKFNHILNLEKQGKIDQLKREVGMGPVKFTSDWTRWAYYTNPSYFMKKKTFQQIRFVSSVHNLLENKIIATKENIHTACQVTEVTVPFLRDRQDRASSLKYFDANLFTQNINTKVSKSGILTTSMNTPGEALNSVISLVTKPFEDGLLGGQSAFNISSHANEAVAVSMLTDSMKYMYDGELLIKGDASIYPCNIINLFDMHSGMTGVVEVRSVVHSFNQNSGFTTTITPDFAVAGVDTERLSAWMYAQRTGVSTAMTYLGAHLFAEAFALKFSRYSKASAPEIVSLLKNDIQFIRRQNLHPEIIDESSLFKSVDEIAADIAKKSPNVKGSRLRYEIFRQLEARYPTKGALDYFRTIKRFDYGLTFLQRSKVAYDIAGKKWDILAKYFRSVPPTAGKIAKAGQAVVKASDSIGKFAASRRVSDAVKAGALTLDAEIIGGIAAKIAKSANVVALVVSVIGGNNLADLIDRKLSSRKSCISMPLRIQGREFSAGIEGHLGSCVGDPGDVIDNTLRGLFNFSSGVEQGTTAVDSGHVFKGYSQMAFSGLMAVLGIQTKDRVDRDIWDEQDLLKSMNIDSYTQLSKVHNFSKVEPIVAKGSVAEGSGLQNSVNAANINDLSNVKWETNAGNASAGLDRNKVNPALIRDISVATRMAGLGSVTITTAKRDHTHLGTQSRHYSYQAVDIAIIDDKGIGDARSNSTMRDKGERLAKALESLGYRRNTESGNSKSVLWYFYTPRAGNHFNHLHISRLWSAK